MTYASGMLQVMRKGVSAAEKYAEIGGRENAPKCECHGLPQHWNKNAALMAGGHYKCAEKAREAWRRRKYRPTRDPNCQKYIDDPTRTWYAGRWATDELIEACRKASLRNSPKRIRAGDTYFGMAATPEQAEKINVHISRRIADFKEAQKEEYANFRETI